MCQYSYRFPAAPSRRLCLISMALAFWVVTGASLTLEAEESKAEIQDSPGAPTISIGMPFGVEWHDDSLWITSIADQSVLVRRPGGETKVVAKNVGFNWPHEVRRDSHGNLFVADTRNHVIRRVDAKSGQVTIVAGTETVGDSAEQFNQPHSVVLLDDHSLLVADTKNHRIQEVDLTTGRITTFCGDGLPKLPVDGQSRETASLFGPRSLAVDDASVWIALREGNSIWRIDRNTDKLQHIAGTGAKGYSGDGGPAISATFSGPKGLAIDESGGVLVVDTENHCVRRIDLTVKTVQTVLGGNLADSTTTLKRPHGITAMGAGGGFWVADSENDRVLLWPPRSLEP